MKPYPTEHPMLDSVYARLLPDRGHDVTWVMWSSSSRDHRKAWRETTVNLVPLHRRSILGVVACRGRLLSRALRIGTRERFDVVQVRNSVAGALVGLLLRRRTGSLFVYQHSFPTIEWLIGRYGRNLRTFASALRFTLAPAIWLRGWILKRADLVLAISEEMRRSLVAFGLSEDRVLALPMGADPPEAVPADHQELLRRELGLGDDPVVLYFGVIAPERQLDFLIRVAERVRDDHPATVWLLLGPAVDGEDRRLRTLGAELGLRDRLRILAPVPRSDVARYVAICDVSVAPIPPTPLYRFSSPTKTVESLALGCPVVATPIPDHEVVVGESGGGELAPFEEEEAFAAAVSRILADPDRARSMGESGREWVMANRSYDRLADGVEAAYRDLLAGRERQRSQETFRAVLSRQRSRPRPPLR